MLAIGRPHATAAGVRDHVSQVFRRTGFAQHQGEEFRSLVVIAEGHQLVVGRVRCTANAEVVLAVGLLVAVNQNGLVIAVMIGAHKQRLLAAGDVFHTVRIFTIR